MPLHGTPIERMAKIRKLPRCAHIHVSGRRCPQPTKVAKSPCGIHKNGTCPECDSMMKTFTPPKGW